MDNQRTFIHNIHIISNLSFLNSLRVKVKRLYLLLLFNGT